MAQLGSLQRRTLTTNAASPAPHDAPLSLPTFQTQLRPPSRCDMISFRRTFTLEECARAHVEFVPCVPATHPRGRMCRLWHTWLEDSLPLWKAEAAHVARNVTREAAGAVLLQGKATSRPTAPCAPTTIEQQRGSLRSDSAGPVPLRGAARPSELSSCFEDTSSLSSIEQSTEQHVCPNRLNSSEPGSEEAPLRCAATWLQALMQQISHAQSTLWLIGDSTTMHTAVAAVCMLRSAASTRSVWQWIVPDWSWNGTARDVLYGRLPHCAAHRMGRICYIPANEASQTPSSILRRLSHLGLLRTSDVAVVNVGLWLQRMKGVLLNEVLELIRFADGSASPQLVWRESFAQHFPGTSSGEYPSHKGLVIGPACSGSVTRRPHELEIVEEMIQQSWKMHFLPTWNHTALLGHLHSRLVPLQARQRQHGGKASEVNSASVIATPNALDCTHYCFGSGVYSNTLHLAAALALTSRR
jgi:hypothetical protein